MSFNDFLGTDDLNCPFFVIPRVLGLRWLGISIRDSISALWRKTVSDTNDKLKIDYGKIIANRSLYNSCALAKFYSSFCGHTILFVTGLCPLLRERNLNLIRINYFRYCKFLCYLSRSYRNRRLVLCYWCYVYSAPSPTGTCFGSVFKTGPSSPSHSVVFCCLYS